MNYRIRYGFAALFLSAVMFEVNQMPRDSTETNLQIYGAHGNYAIVRRGCSGNVLEKHKISFSEYNASLDHKFSYPVRLGIRSGYIFDKKLTHEEHYNPQRGYETTARFMSRENLTINPYINFETKPFGIGLGYFWARYPLHGSESLDEIDPHYSAYLRVGHRRSLYFSFSYLHHVPLYSSSLLRFGLGSGNNPSFDWWLGMGLMGPHDKAGFLMTSDVGIHCHLKLNLLARIGWSEGIGENAIGVGLTYH